MKIFVSWSGERSKQVALALRHWLPDVMHGVKPWMSDTDIPKGTSWSQSIATELESSDAGVICVTPENKNRPWLLFESGALSKHFNSRPLVCTYLLGMRPTDIDGPLTLYQTTVAEKEDTWKMVDTINAARGDSRLAADALRRSFDRCWPELARDLEKIPSPSGASEGHTDDVNPLEYQETRLPRKNFHNMLESAEKFIDWYTLNFGNVRVGGTWHKIGDILRDRIQAGVHVRILTLHPASFLPTHLEIALLKRAGSGTHSIQDVRKRCLRGVRDLQILARQLATPEASPDARGSLSVKCTRAIPKFGLVATERCLKLEFYPADWRIPTTDRCTMTIREPTFDAASSCWRRDFDNLWNSHADLQEDQWLQGFRPEPRRSNLTTDLRDQTLSKQSLKDIESLLEAREHSLEGLIAEVH